MGLIRSLFRADTGGSRAPDSDFWYNPVATASGQRITADSCLSSSPIWGAVRILSESVASLPLHLYQRLPNGRGKARALGAPLYSTLHDAPNPYQSAQQFWRLLMTGALLWGDAYALKKPAPGGRSHHLLPLHPDGVRIEASKQLGEPPTYYLRQADGTEKPYQHYQLFHFNGLSLNGHSGLSIMRYARASIGLNLSAREYSERFFGNGARPSGVLEHPGKLTKQAREQLRDSWDEIHRGLAGAHRVAVLQEGMKYSATGLSNEDAQLLSLLDWSLEDCARYLNVPPFMLGATSKVTSWGSGIEQLSIGFVTYSLMPWLVNIQQAIWLDLIEQRDQPFMFAEFLTDALLRGDTASRFAAYQSAAGGPAPWLTRNEIRIRENLNPLPGLDAPLQPLNMGGAATNKGQPGQPPPPPAGEHTNGHILLALEELTR